MGLRLNSVAEEQYTKAPKEKPGRMGKASGTMKKNAIFSKLPKRRVNLTNYSVLAGWMKGADSTNHPCKQSSRRRWQDRQDF
jgi:hypothetical protein